MDEVVIAILAKNKERFLPLYLKCIENQTYDPKKIHLYIRTNNNTDQTKEILREWVKKVKRKYKSVIFKTRNVKEKVERFQEHEWNGERFQVLGRIRQKSVKYAIRKKAHYFVVDCDNFIIPSTLETLMSYRLEVVAPMLKQPSGVYSNFHHCTTPNGYYTDCSDYFSILNRNQPQLHLCNVVHCTYLIRRDVLPKVKYLDKTGDYEYVIFSRTCRNLSVNQYLDNSKEYGYLTLEDNDKANIEELENLVLK